MLAGAGDFSDTVNDDKVKQEVGVLKVLHFLGAAAVSANLIYQGTTSREDDNHLEYRVFGTRPYFSHVERQDASTALTGAAFKYELGSQENPNSGWHFNLANALFWAQLIGVFYHVGSLIRVQLGDSGLVGLGGLVQKAGSSVRATGRLRTRQLRALYNIFALGLVQLTIMLVVGLQDEWLYLFVFLTHMAYHTSILQIDSDAHRPKRFLGTVLIVLGIAVMNSWFFYSISRVESTSLYRPRISDLEVARTVVTAADGSTPATYVNTLPDCACTTFTNPTATTDIAVVTFLDNCYAAPTHAILAGGLPLIPNPLVTNVLGGFTQLHGPLADPGTTQGADGTGGEGASFVDLTAACFDVFGEVVPTSKTLDYLVAAHVAINIAYVIHLIATKWPTHLYDGGFDMDNLGFNPREWWLVSQDLGYVLLDFMYMAAVPAGVYTMHRELSRASFPHQVEADKDDFDWEEFQVIYFWIAVAIGVSGLAYVRARFRGNVRERQHVRDVANGQLFVDGMPTPSGVKREAQSLINTKMVTGMARGENTPMLGVAYA